MNTCGACAHHRMTGPLAAHGFGLCAVRPDQDKRAAITTPAQALCRIGRFEAKKQDEAIPVPEIAKRGSQGPGEAGEGHSDTTRPFMESAS